MTRPFKVLGIQQIAIGGISKDRLRTLWVDMLGLSVEGHFVSERENVDTVLQIFGMIFKTFSSKTMFIEFEGMNHGSHRPIENCDTGAQNFVKVSRSILIQRDSHWELES